MQFLQPPGWATPKGYANGIAAKGTLTEYLARRRSRDPDIWVIELDVANRAQFDAILGQLG